MTTTNDPIDLYLDIGKRGRETDAAHGLIDIAAAIAEQHWRGTPLSERVEAVIKQIEADVAAQGVSEFLISDQLTELLCAYDMLARQTARLSFGLLHTLNTSTAASFEAWIAASERWLEANHCGQPGHVVDGPAVDGDSA